MGLFHLLDRIQQDQTTWSEVLPQGQNEPSYRSIVQAMGLIHHLFGLATPPDLLPLIASADSTGAALQSEAIRQIALPPDQLSSTTEWLRQLRYRTQLEPGRNGFTAALRAHIFSPLNWQVVKLKHLKQWVLKLWLMQALQTMLLHFTIKSCKL